MTRFEVESHVGGRTPLDVLRLLREETPNLAPLLPNARSIEVLGRRPEFTRWKWQGRGEIPGAVRHLVSEADLTWVEETTWDEAGLAAASVVQRPGIGGVRCDTYVAFVPDGTGCRIRVEGEVRVGLPLLGGFVERFIVKKVEENLRALSEAVNDWPHVLTLHGAETTEVRPQNP